MVKLGNCLICMGGTCFILGISGYDHTPFLCAAVALAGLFLAWTGHNMRTLKLTKAVLLFAGMLVLTGGLFVYCHNCTSITYAQNGGEGSSEQYREMREQAGEEFNICPELLMAVIEAESGGNIAAVGSRGEIGLMQIYPAFHWDRLEEMTENSTASYEAMVVPETNIRLGASYLAELFQEFEDPGTVLMLYNGTKDAVIRGRRGDYTDYAKDILERSGELEKLHGK